MNASKLTGYLRSFTSSPMNSAATAIEDMGLIGMALIESQTSLRTRMRLEICEQLGEGWLFEVWPPMGPLEQERGHGERFLVKGEPNAVPMLTDDARKAIKYALDLSLASHAANARASGSVSNA